MIAKVPANAECVREEIFGPVAAIQTFRDQDEAIVRANDTEYGLVAYVFTRDMKRGMRVCEQLDFGMVGLNRGLVSDPAAPFGGMKQSGLGREGGHEGHVRIHGDPIHLCELVRGAPMSFFASPAVRAEARRTGIELSGRSERRGPRDVVA